MSLPTMTDIPWAVTMKNNKEAPPHQGPLSLRSSQRLAVRSLIEATHQATGAHCVLQATGPSVLPPPSQPLSACVSL